MFGLTQSPIWYVKDTIIMAACIAKFYPNLPSCHSEGQLFGVQFCVEKNTYKVNSATHSYLTLYCELY